jgi:hypothetical protein
MLIRVKVEQNVLAVGSMDGDIPRYIEFSV